MYIFEVIFDQLTLDRLLVDTPGTIKRLVSKLTENS